MRAIVTFFILILCFSLQAADFTAGTDLKLEGKYSGNVYAAGETITLASPIKGDLVVAGKTIVISDSVYQDLVGAGGELLISEYVGGDARLAGGMIEINTNIGGDLIIFGGEVTIKKGVTVYGDLVIFGGEVVVNGTINGKLILKCGEAEINGSVRETMNVAGGTVKLNGPVSGPAQIVSEKITLGDSATFYKQVTYWQEDGELSFSPYLKGDAKADFDPALAPQNQGNLKEKAISFFLIFSVITAFSALILLLAFSYFFPDFFLSSGKVLGEEFTKSLGIGLLFILGVPVLSIMLMMIIIGIPLGILLLFTYILVLLPAHILTSLVLTNWIKQKYKKSWNMGITILIAFFIYLLLKVIFLIPVAGFLASVIIVLAAYGAMATTVKRSYKSKSDSSDI